jgi:hypothetical protein
MIPTFVLEWHAELNSYTVYQEDGLYFVVGRFRTIDGEKTRRGQFVRMMDLYSVLVRWPTQLIPSAVLAELWKLVCVELDRTGSVYPYEQPQLA